MRHQPCTHASQQQGHWGLESRNHHLCTQCPSIQIHRQRSRHRLECAFLRWKYPRCENSTHQHESSFQRTSKEEQKCTKQTWKANRYALQKKKQETLSAMKRQRHSWYQNATKDCALRPSTVYYRIFCTTNPYSLYCRRNPEEKEVSVTCIMVQWSAHKSSTEIKTHNRTQFPNQTKLVPRTTRSDLFAQSSTPK